MNIASLRRREILIGTGLVAVLGCALGWAVWGANAWHVHAAKSAVAERINAPNPVFRKVSVGPKPLQTVCGEVSVDGQPYRRFMAGARFARFDRTSADEHDSEFWTEYWRECIDAEQYIDSIITS